MKSLRESLFDSKTQMTESLFDKDIVSKDITIGQYFEVSVERHGIDDLMRSKDDKKAMKELTNTISSMNLKHTDCIGVIRILARLTKEYVRNWNGGGYSYRVYDDQKHLLKSKQIESIDLINDVNMIYLSIEDWDKNHNIFHTYIVLTRK